MATFTRRAIMDACITLLEERPYDKISVKDIVELCGINRNTFYYHFEDLPSLIREMLQDEAKRIIDEYDATGSMRECLESVMRFAMENRRAAMHLYNSANREAFERNLMDISQNLISRFINKLCEGQPISDEDKRLIIEAYKWESVGMVICWLSGGMKEDLMRDVVRLCALREDMIQETIDKCVEG